MFARPPAHRTRFALLLLLSAALLAACAPISATPTDPAAAGTAAEAAPAAPAGAPPAGAPPAGAPPPGADVVPGGPGGAMTFASVPPTHADLAYAGESETQKLDLYLPTAGAGPFPLVVMIHGGGFMFGSKEDGMGLTGVDQLLADGFAVASINYRLSGEATWPAQIHDAKAAVRYLRAVAGDYNLDPENFAAWGASAGGNLAAMLGASCDVAELEGELGNPGQSSCVQAVVDWFGPIDFLALDEQFAGTECPQTHDAADSPESQLMGAPIQDVPELVATSNPLNYIDGNEPPFLIQHGSADCNIPPVQGQNLADALGAELATYTLLDGAGHGGEQFATEENLQLVFDFLNGQLK